MSVQTPMIQPMQPKPPVVSGLLQRQCACGNHAAGGECEACKKIRNGLQRQLAIGASNDPLEQEADRVAEQMLAAPAHAAVNRTAPCIQRYPGQATSAVSAAPASVDRTLASSGSPLGPALRQDMEQRFGHDFSQVRVHSDTAAAQSARDVNAHAYTVGNHIVFGAGQYTPSSSAGRKLLSHELTHVIQQSNRAEPGIRTRQTLQRQTTQGAAPREDVVYVMGDDGFYRVATRFFRARIPNATFVTNRRNLRDLLTHLNANFNSPLGNIFIVSHANEDGTLAFGLNRTDRDHQLTAVELRNALSASSGASGLPSVSHLVDQQTRIRIKGCDLGRNQQIVELFDRAFGGQGVVTAPTHEQGYSFDTREIRTATAAAMAEHLQEFEEGLDPIPDAPEPVDRSLRGQARRDAQQAFRAATAARRSAQTQRRRAIAAERRRFASEARRLGEEGGTHEFLSGPMFQRPGATLFTQAELRAQVDGLYPHLPVPRRADLVRRLSAADRRDTHTAQRQGTFRQQGQRAYHYENRFTYMDPVTAAQINAAFRRSFRRHHFVLESFTMTTRSEGTRTVHDYQMTGHDSRHRRGQQAQARTFNGSSAAVEADNVLLQRVQAIVNNPDKFNWRVDSNRTADGNLTKTVVRERVVAYLHHGSLDVSRSNRFIRPESDRRFFAESTFAPPRTP